MSNGINLATNKRTTRSAFFNQLRVLRFGAAGILALIAAVSMVLFFLIAASPLPGLKRQENGALFQITQLHPKIAKYLLVNERVTAITQLMQARDSKSTNLTKLESQIPRQANVESIQIDDKGMLLTVSSVSLGTINTFISNLLDNTGVSKPFSSVVLNSLVYNTKANDYHVSLDITL